MGGTTTLKTKEKITITEIAEKSGVSIATVSRIINGKESVKEATKLSVLNTINQLEEEYGITSKLLNRPSNSIILLIAELGSPIIDTFSAGLENCALRRGFHVITMDYSRNRTNFLDEFNYYAKTMSIAGVIMLNYYEEIFVLDSIALRYPIVVAFNHIESNTISSISTNDYVSAKAAIEYLISIGKKKIAILGLDNSFPFSTLREKGALTALKNANLTTPNEWIMHVPDFDFDMVSNTLQLLFNSQQIPDAIFAINDSLAAVCIREAKRFGYNIPNDIAIIGFDNSSIATLVDPNITTINQPSYQIGVQGANLLIDKIQNPDLPSQSIVLKGEFIVRGSTQSVLN
jgi:DNA-binding LacI/PurR family transcriptional regulator